LAKISRPQLLERSLHEIPSPRRHAPPVEAGPLQSPFPRRHCSSPCLSPGSRGPAPLPRLPSHDPTPPCALMDTPTKRLCVSRERNPQQHLQLMKKNMRPSEITRGQATIEEVIFPYVQISILMLMSTCLLVAC
jgi:hypothetical protein